jgi:predicted membrane-bound dolichyl-phosphate-mannose-protein mannosyltransferase
MEIKKNLARIYRWEYFWLCLLVAATLAMHFGIITNPPELILDEQHYVNDVRNIMEKHETLRLEHPPLGKLFIVAGDYIFNGFKTPLKSTGTTTRQAISSDSTDTVIDVSDASVFSAGKTLRIDDEQMNIQSINTTLNQITVVRGVGGTTIASHAAQQTIYVFEDKALGWRFFSVIFGTAAIVLFYLLCRRLNMSRTAASIATFLLAFENMTFVHASIAMLDVYYLAFMMAAFLLYASRKYISSGVAAGLSALAKLNGALALPTIVIHWLFTRQKRSWWFLLTVVLAPLTFVELMIPLDYAVVQRWSALADPISRIKTMLSLSSELTFANTTHPALSRPWEWLLTYKPMAYWITPHYTGAISFSIWALIMPTFAYMIYRAVRRDEAGLFGAAWFFSTYLLWIPASLITNRVSYIYYFYPTIGAICLGVGLGLGQLCDVFHRRPKGKLKWTALSIVIFFLLVHLASFVILSPLLPIPYDNMLRFIHWPT